jgi:hypothetical protein
MSTEAEELHRIISTSVRGMLDAFRIQASAGPLTDKALEEIFFRAELTQPSRWKGFGNSVGCISAGAAPRGGD